MHAVRSLLASVQVHADVIRDGTETEVILDEVVVGDVVVLRAGDVIPADARLLSADDLHVDESALTGESYPVHKKVGIVDATAGRIRAAEQRLPGHARQQWCGDRSRRCDRASITAGTNRHGAQSHGATNDIRARTSFVRIPAHESWRCAGRCGLRGQLGLSSSCSGLLALLARPRDRYHATTASRSRDAHSVARCTEMARERVIVKRLSSIEDFGSIDVLCVDKTGTLTLGAVRMEAALDLEGLPSPAVATMAWRNAYHQDGFTNPIDQAILASASLPSGPRHQARRAPVRLHEKATERCDAGRQRDHSRDEGRICLGTECLFNCTKLRSNRCPDRRNGRRPR